MIRSRYRRIITFFAFTIIKLIFWELFLPKVGFKVYVKRTRSNRLSNIARKYRSLAINMGGVLIKVGQFLSSRVDVLPEEITHELSGLQDEVPPESFKDIQKVAEAEFGISLQDKYHNFNEEPIASASLGQVYQAQLWVLNPSSSELQTQVEGEYPDDQSSEKNVEIFNVVVKIQRPKIEEIINTDLAALKTVGRWLQRYPPIRKRANIPALFDEFSRTLYEEIDYIAEGHNAETFADNFTDEPAICVPRVIWTHTTKRILTLEDVRGIKITDYEAISDVGVSRLEVAARLLDTYLKQIFEDGFFHADPHPGNLFVNPIEYREDSGTQGGNPFLLTFVDFGMVGRLTPDMRDGMRELLIGVGTRDASRIITAYQKLGVLLPGADLALIEKAEVEMFNRFWGKSMSEYQQINFQEMSDFMLEFRELIFDLPFQVPQDMIFLFRAIGILSGMCTGLDPEFNVWDHIVPYAKKYIVDESVFDPELWLDELGDIVRKLITIPRRTDTLLTKALRGELQVQDPGLIKEVKKVDTSIRKATGGIIFAAFLIGGIQLYIVDEFIFSGIMFLGSGISLFWIIFIGRER
jgi:predicted unusual protein kinase regulating ubiquinone biosynthesis (AarF/ABC1/UbiB family)